MSSPTERSLAFARKLGFTIGVVEKWISQRKIRMDFLGCIDLIAVREGVGVVGIQACARCDHAKRRAKAMAEPRLRAWLAAGARFEVWSWALMGARGERKVWKCWRDEVHLCEMPPVPPDEETEQAPALFAGAGGGK